MRGEDGFIGGFVQGAGAALGLDGGGGRSRGSGGVGAGSHRDASLSDMRGTTRDVWLLSRPSLPLTLWLALGLWTGIAVVFPALRLADEKACLVILACALVPGAMLVAALCLGMGKAAVLVFAIGLAVGGVCGGSSAWQMHRAQRQLLVQSDPAIVDLVQDAGPGAFGTTVTGRVHLEGGGTARVRVNLADSAHLMGTERIRVHVTWHEPSTTTAETCWTKGIAATANASSYERVAAHGLPAALCQLRWSAVHLIEGLPAGEGPGAQFLEAVLLGWRANMFDSDWYAAAKADGLAHMVAVSGAHLAIVCGISLAVMGRIGVRRRVQWAVQILLIASYLALTGVAVSAVRAAFMTVIGLSAFLARRRPYSLGALAIAIAAMLALDPCSAFSVSFTLSAASTLGIVLFARYFERFGTVLLGKERPGALLSAFALTMAAQVMTDPLSASEFGQVSLIAPVANALMGPCFTAVCGLGLPLVLVGVAWGGAVPLLNLLAQGCALLCGLMQALARIPFASVPISLDPVVALALAVTVPALLWALWPRPSLRLVTGAALAAAALVGVLGLGALAAGDEVVMLDVGQGDAFVLRSGDKTVLIDTGNHDKELLQGLARHRVYRLDAVVITHADDDHCGSLPALKGVVPVERVVVAADMLTCAEEKARALVRTAADVCGDDRAVAGVPAGGQLAFGNYVCKVVGPQHFSDGGGNADSLTLLVEADETHDGQPEWRGLFCGDAEKDRIAAYEAAGLVGDVDLYKVGHHGSRVAIDRQTAEVLRPEICLVSVGAHNRYGHPVPSTLETLEAVGGRVWRTDEQGDVTCSLSAAGIQVRTQR